jgi:hypothetical protein
MAFITSYSIADVAFSNSVDNPPLFSNFGDVTTDVEKSYSTGDTASATFIGANPRVRGEKSIFVVR